MVRLTELASGGGCGCKIAPDRLRALLDTLPQAALADGRLLVGPRTRDDAAVYQTGEDRAIIATTDFFSPVVDDPRHFGHIAATNALSDVYAMGGRPLFALSILAMPAGKVDDATVAEILRGGADACGEAGIPIAGGHSIDSAEPIYGLAVTGEAGIREVRTNAMARPGDALILGKPLGIGILAAALRKGRLDDQGLEAMLRNAMRPNRVGRALAEKSLVNAMTDVTGFGLLGHLAELCEASACAVSVDTGRVPLIGEAVRLARDGVRTGASARNWRSVEGITEGARDLDEWLLALLADPQTSGGLLVTCAPDKAGAACALLRDHGHAEARVIGEVSAGKPAIRLAPGGAE